MDRLPLLPNTSSINLWSRLMVLLLCFPLSILAQYPDLRPAWDRDFGGNIWEDLHAIEETRDGGYILAGFSSSSANGDITEPTRGAGDFWVVKTDDEGLMEWNRRYGGTGMEQAWAVKQTADGGYLVAGWSDSDLSGEKSANSRGYLDYWVVRIDPLGNYLWDATYGGDSTDFLYDLEITADGGFIIGGMSHSGSSGEKSAPSRGDLDLWVVKANALGAVEWERSYGGNGEDRLNEIVIDTDGHFLLGGGTRSDVGDEVAFPNYGVKDFWLLKIDQTNGDTIWTRRYGGDDEDEIISFVVTSDNGFLLGGASRSNPGFDKTEPAEGITDMWVVKTDRAGTVLWDRTFGGPALESCYAVKENTIGNYLIGGYSGSDAGIHKTENSRGGLDYWLVYLDPDGTKQWDKTLGGDRDDVLENLFQTSDGGYMLAGHSQSDPSGDKTSDNKGLNDYWIIKTDCALVLDLPDTVACPDQAFILDAYDPQCIACDWIWDDSTTDSVRTVIPTRDTRYAVTLTDGVGCARNDEINLQVLTPPTVDLGDDQVICPGTSGILDAENAGLSYQWSTRDSSQVISVDTSGRFAVTVTDDDGCFSVDSVQVTVTTPPQVDLGPDTTFCLGQSITLDAGIFPDVDYRWFPSGNRQTLEVDDPGDYRVRVTDRNGCTSMDTIGVTAYDAPLVLDLTTSCDPANSKYVVQFTLVGGDSASYLVTGTTGNLSGRVFVSDSIPKDSFYNFLVTDGRNCLPLRLTDRYDCDCETEAGVLDNDPYLACGDETIRVTLASPPQTDADDTSIFVLHDGDEQTIGNILFENTSGEFRYNLSLDYGQIYYVTVLTGNAIGSSVDLSDGCLATAQGVPVVFYPQPVATILPIGPISLTCNNNSVVLDGSASVPRPDLTFDWSFGNGGNIIGNEDGPQVEVDAAAEYILTVEALQSGCIDTAMYRVRADDGLPQVEILDPPGYTCQDTLLRLDASASSEGSNFIYQWTGPGILDGGNALRPLINLPGEYTLMITNLNNACTATRTVRVRADTLAPDVEVEAMAYLDCLTAQVRLDGEVSTQGDAIVSWTTPDGRFVDDPTRLDPVVDQAGSYQLSVIDSQNGCTNAAEVTVTNDPDLPSGILTEVRSPQCFGEANGELIVTEIQGGTAPWLISFADQPFRDQRLYRNLAAGTYPLVIQDAKGCEWDTTVELSNPPYFLVDLGPSQELDFGDSLLFVPFVNQEVIRVSWNPSIFVSHPDSLITYARPLQSTNFTLTVTDSLGCTQSATVQIKVDIERRVFVPNVFSPNFDGHNDGFTVFGGKGVEQVKLLRVLDRWGAVVYEASDFPPSIPSLGWNGVYQGEAVNPGVYIYQAVVVFSDGAEIQYQGDVTVVK